MRPGRVSPDALGHLAVARTHPVERWERERNDEGGAGNRNPAVDKPELGRSRVGNARRGERRRRHTRTPTRAPRIEGVDHRHGELVVTWALYVFGMFRWYV